MLVLDASVAATWIFPDEGSEYAERILDMLRTSEAIVPHVWPLEIANLLLVAERRQRLTAAQAVQAAHVLQALPIRVGSEPSVGEVQVLLAVGRRGHLSAYDASYLELAMREGLPLATLDGRMRAAAENLGVEPA